MISLILYTRLVERQTSPDEVKAIFRTLAPLEFHIRPCGGSPSDSYFAPKHDGTNPTGGDPDYPNLAELDAATVDEWGALADRLTNPALKARFADAVWELAKRLAPARRDRYRFAVMAIESYLKASREGRYGSPVLQLEPMARAVSLALSINSEGQLVDPCFSRDRDRNTNGNDNCNARKPTLNCFWSLAVLLLGCAIGLHRKTTPGVAFWPFASRALVRC